MASKCSCIRGNFDFYIEQNQCSKIIYHDRSTWQTGSEYITPPTYTLNVKDQGGFTKQFQIIVGVSTELDLGKCPEGIYTFSVTSCTETFTKWAAILCNLYCGYLKAISKIGKGIDVEIVRSIRERLEYIEQTVNGDFLTAKSLVASVEIDLKHINCLCSCY